MNFTVALLQIASFSNDQARNLEKGLRRCREAKSLNADLVVEHWICSLSSRSDWTRILDRCCH